MGGIGNMVIGEDQSPRLATIPTYIHHRLVVNNNQLIERLPCFLPRQNSMQTPPVSNRVMQSNKKGRRRWNVELRSGEERDRGTSEMDQTEEKERHIGDSSSVRLLKSDRFGYTEGYVWRMVMTDGFDVVMWKDAPPHLHQYNCDTHHVVEEERVGD